MESEAFEVQVLPEDGNDSKSHCLVVPTDRSGNASNSDKFNVTKAADAQLDLDDASTARTELSTDADDTSTLRERFSYGSLTFGDGGTFNSPASSFDLAGIPITRSNRGHLFNIAEFNGKIATNENKPGEYQNNASLFDLDDGDDSSDDGIKTTLENKLSSESFARCHRKGGPSDFAVDGSFVGNLLSEDSRLEFYDGPSFAAATPASISMAGRTLRTTESGAQFYRGYSQASFMSPGGAAGNKLNQSERVRAKFYGGDVRSSGSMFKDGTLNTDSRIGFYRVSCSETAEPLSCREKVLQPALSCDDSFWENQSDDKYDITPTKKKSSKNSAEEKSGSIFSAVTCCFTPDQP